MRYNMFMPKKPLSVTLEEDNILWLRGQTLGGKQRSLSEALDVVVTAARQSRFGASPRSVVGTVDITSDDPDLQSADAAMRSLVDASLGRAAAKGRSRA